MELPEVQTSSKKEFGFLAGNPKFYFYFNYKNLSFKMFLNENW
jgi:hypothetical protein